MSNEGVKLGRLTLLEKAKLLNTFDGEFFLFWSIVFIRGVNFYILYYYAKKFFTFLKKLENIKEIFF